MITFQKLLYQTKADQVQQYAVDAFPSFAPRAAPSFKQVPFSVYKITISKLVAKSFCNWAPEVTEYFCLLHLLTAGPS